MSFITRRKTIEASIALEGSHRLKATLSWPHLVAMGVGAIVGTGIYTLTGVGAGLAGPAVILSFLICGAICACAAFCYAEMATMIPVAGSAYTYSYAVLGETIAWIVGWSLILEYTVAAAAVAVGWAGHAEAIIHAAGWPVPAALLHGIASGGLVNVPAVLIAAVVTLLLVIGTRESATLNIVLVLIKLSALVLFVVLASQSFDSANFHPFAPFGYGATADGSGRNFGVLGAAAIVFFAFYGFDTVSTAAEETKKPSRNLTIGIIGSMALCTAIYVIVATVAVGAMSFKLFSQSHEAAPLVYILQSLNHGTAAQIVAAAVVIAIPSVILVLMYGQSRIFFVMARDGLLPLRLAAVHKTRGTPVLMTTLTGLVVMVMAATLDLSQIVELANVGTLTAFIAVAASMLVLRVRDPNRLRIFRTPLPWIVGPFCILGCLYLVLGLPRFTQAWFLFWNGAGITLYLQSSVWNSKLSGGPMPNLIWKFLGFQGRTGRRDYWICLLTTIVAAVVVGAALLRFISWSNTLMIQGIAKDVVMFATSFVAGIFSVMFFLPIVAIQVKRAHDRGKSALWVLVFAIPVIGNLWALVELGLFPGSKDTNRFGPALA